MSSWNSSKIIIEINLKNNAKVDIKMWIGGNMAPMGENSDLPTSPAVEEINSGDTLLQYIIKSYLPDFEGHWSEYDHFGFELDDNGLNGCEKILKIKDFNLVNEIIIKERFEYEWEGMKTTVRNFVIDDKNCPFIHRRPVFCDSELKQKKPTFPPNISSVGKNAFLGCDNLDIFVEKNTPTHMCMKKEGIPHYVIGQSSVNIESVENTNKRIHSCWELTDNYGEYFDVLRLVTLEDVYILYLQQSDNDLYENELSNVFFDPIDYMPEIVEHKLVWKEDLEIKNVVELATALFFIVSDKIDFEFIKTYLAYSANKIDFQEASKVFLNCHKVGLLHVFEKGSFDEINKINLLFMNDEEQKNANLNIIRGVFECIIPDFGKLIEPFVEVCNNIDEISDILYAESSQGIVGENELDAEEMWKTDFKLDFSLLK